MVPSSLGVSPRSGGGKGPGWGSLVFLMMFGAALFYLVGTVRGTFRPGGAGGVAGSGQSGNVATVVAELGPVGEGVAASGGGVAGEAEVEPGAMTEVQRFYAARPLWQELGELETELRLMGAAATSSPESAVVRGLAFGPVVEGRLIDGAATRGVRVRVFAPGATKAIGELMIREAHLPAVESVMLRAVLDNYGATEGKPGPHVRLVNAWLDRLAAGPPADPRHWMFDSTAFGRMVLDEQTIPVRYFGSDWPAATVQNYSDAAALLAQLIAEDAGDALRVLAAGFAGEAEAGGSVRLPVWHGHVTGGRVTDLVTQEALRQAEISVLHRVAWAVPTLSGDAGQRAAGALRAWVERLERAGLDAAGEQVVRQVRERLAREVGRGG